MTRPLKLKVSEADFQATVLGVARTLGWRAVHHRPAWTSKGWRTPLSGDPGFPDVVLCRDRVLFVELKSDTGQLRPEQRAWRDALLAAGAEWHCWRPRDWDTIRDTLTRRP